MGKLAVGALRAMLGVLLTGTVLVQALMVRALATKPVTGSLPLTPLRVITIVGMVSIEVALVCVWRLVTMVRRGTVFSHAAFRYVDVVIGAIVSASLVWFAVTVSMRRASGPTLASRPSWAGLAWPSWASRSSCSCCGCCSPRPSRVTSKRRSCGPNWTR